MKTNQDQVEQEEVIEVVEPIVKNEDFNDHQVPSNSPPSSLLQSPLEAYTARLTSDADYARYYILTFLASEIASAPLVTSQIFFHYHYPNLYYCG